MINVRQQVALYVNKINRAITKLDYIMELRDSFEVSALDPSFPNIGDWAQEIKVYWEESNSKEIGNEILKIGSSANLYKLLLSYKMPNDIRGSISLYVDTMEELRASIIDIQNHEKGEYYLLPEAIANKEAANLLERAVDAGYLNKEYQPNENTSSAQLRFLAYAIGTSLHLKHKWAPFETLWNSQKLPCVYIPKTKSVDFEDILALYPEVDFSEISNDLNTIQAICNAPVTPVIVEDCNEDPVNTHFNSEKNHKDLTKVFINLKEHKYINSDTTIKQWLYMCTGDSTLKQHYKPIMWNKELRHLVILVMELFDKSDCYRKWAITSNGFRIKKDNVYQMIKPDNLRRANSDIVPGCLSKRQQAFYDLMFK